MLFRTGDQVGVSVKGRMVAGPATIMGINRELTYMYDIRYPNGDEPSVINYDLFPYWDQLKIGDLVPTHIPLRKILSKRAVDQAIRDICDPRWIESEPGGPADVLRAFVGAAAPIGCGRISSDYGLRWKRQKN